MQARHEKASVFSNPVDHNWYVTKGRGLQGRNEIQDFLKGVGSGSSKGRSVAIFKLTWKLKKTNSN